MHDGLVVGYRQGLPIGRIAQAAGPAFQFGDGPLLVAGEVEQQELAIERRRQSLAIRTERQGATGIDLDAAFAFARLRVNYGNLRLLAVVENYPDLKANQNVLSLQEELTTTENQISFSRQHYNATVLDYNTAIQTVPNVFIAGPLGFTRREFFDAEPEATNVPNVDLSLS